MKKMLLCGLLCIAHVAVAAEGPVFTNDTLKKYDDMPRPDQQWTTPPAEAPGIRTDRTDKGGDSDSRSRQYYCDQATRHRQDIERAESGLVAANKKTIAKRLYDPDRRQYVTFNYKDEAAVARAQEALDNAKARLEQFEETARKNGAEPGWVRCDK